MMRMSDSGYKQKVAEFISLAQQTADIAAELENISDYFMKELDIVKLVNDLDAKARWARIHLKNMYGSEAEHDRGCAARFP